MNLIDTLLNFLLITMLGLLIAFSPMLVLVNLIVVLKSSRPILRSLVLMAGMVTPLLIVALLGLLLLKPSSQINLESLHASLKIPPLIDLLFGLWLLSVGIKRWRYSRLHNGPRRSATLIMKHPPDKYSALFVFAFAKSILSVTNLFAILIVTKLIVTQSLGPTLAGLAIIWVILIGLAPFGAILYYYFFQHAQLEHLSAQVDRVLNRDVDSAINLALIVAGGLFFLGGCVHL